MRQSHVDKQGRRRDYQSVHLRRTFCDGARVRNETECSSGAAGPYSSVTW
jgi:hypothetical protein